MDLSFFDAVMAWLEHHQLWLGPVIAIVSCVESLVAVGIVVPGVAMLFALGAIAGTGIMSVWTVLAWAFVGAVIGDGVSYWLGHRYHAGLKKMWPFNQHPEWLGHGEQFFYKYGAFSVVIGRFVGAVRPFIPVVAGMMDMPPAKFYTINVLSALAWAPVYLLPGYFAGAAMSMDDQFPLQLWMLLGGLSAVAFLLPGMLLWLHWRYRFRPLLPALVTGILFLVMLVLELTGSLQLLNIQAARWLDVLRLPWLIDVMSWLTWLGSLPVALLLVVLCFSVQYIRRQPTGISLLLWLIPLMEASLWLAKRSVNSARPELVVNLDPFSFPSGHTTQAAFFLIFLAKHGTSRLSAKIQWGAYSTALLLIMLVGLSRLILNVHWLGDVLAGFTLGLFWLSMVSVAEKAKTRLGR